MLKGARSKRGDERPSEIGIARITNVKSSDKMMKKRGVKEAISPTIAEKYT